MHFVNDGEETIELVTWSRRTLEKYCHAQSDTHYPVSQAGVWADALRRHQPVLINDHLALDHKHGLPAGHAGLERMISVPILEEARIVLTQCLRGDPERLHQAMLNPADNAVKFTSQGRITLRAKLEEERDDTVRVRFEVSDTGVGISEESQDRLFRLFEQVDNSSTRKHGGTGLGLAITRRLANLMDGTVGVDSSPGKGSTFWFTAVLQRLHQSACGP